MSPTPEQTKSQPDAYTQALMDVARSSPCVAQEDIYNEFGVLLVRKGEPIQASTADHLSAHALEKPIDDVVGLQQRLSSRNLFAVYNRLLAQQADLGFICSEEDTALRLRHWCMHRELNSAIAQKLTVMMRTRPALFERTLAGAVLAGLIAMEGGLSPAVQTRVFDAALVRDIGMLHQPAQAADDPRLHGQDREHIRLSMRILDQSRGYDDELVLIVGAHHERPGGLGYPEGRQDIRLESAVIELADRAWAYARHLCPGGPVALSVLKPWLQTQDRGAGAEWAQALLRMLAREALPLPRPPIPAETLQSQVMTRTLQVSQIFSLLPVLMDRLAAAGSRYTQTVQVLTGYVSESGLGNIESLEMIAEQGECAMSPEELWDINVAQEVFLERAGRLAQCLTCEGGLAPGDQALVNELMTIAQQAMAAD